MKIMVSKRDSIEIEQRAYIKIRKLLGDTPKKFMGICQIFIMIFFHIQRQSEGLNNSIKVQHQDKTRIILEDRLIYRPRCAQP